ncbi:hypothetical protein HYALB_00009222 [Hymenoscyphus albidus]|uniref:Uncharacterized protein n=1 Tax=Hymenoscyphus albidus TaxID=595503 RepID=A0A9N9LCG7_9HELO|nr:hypothetical protein HYALB_00009222 [Hymenoscyphus albidus]
MPSKRLSKSNILLIASTAMATISLGFGINAILNPSNALSFFEFDYPTDPPTQKLIDNLMIIYGVCDIFWGIAMYAPAYYGDRKSLGWICLAGSGVAFADGAVCFAAGKGEWGHWGYAPALTAIGSMLLGIFDKA